MTGDSIEGTDSLAATQRRYMTILFCDLVGSTELSEALDPEDLREVQIRYQRLALTVMERYGGFVASTRGDGLLVYFGYPTAHENDGERAVRAALGFLDLVPGLEVKLADQAPTPISVRIGIHTGLVVVGPDVTSPGRQEHSVVGETANLAARLQSLAEPNTVVVSGETLGTIEELFDTEPLGPTPIKGLSRLVAVHRVLKSRPLSSRTLSRWRRSATRMIGRRPETEQIVKLARAATRDSRCRTVLIAGDAGIGKTRLASEVCQQPELARFNVVQASCLEMYATTPLYPAANLLWTRSGLNADDDEETRTAKITALLGAAGLAEPENVDVVANLLGIAMPGSDASRPAAQPLEVRQKQFGLIRAWLSRIARDEPLLLWLEDAHWLDPSSAELHGLLLATLADTPSLVLITSRTYPKGPALPPADETIQLEHLRFDECVQLAQAIPGAATLPPALLARAAEMGDGVPLFVEQLVVSQIGKNPAEARARDGELLLPLTLAETLSERLDRLPGGRRIVQTAACIGRSFSLGFLASLLQSPEADLIEPLEALVATEILVPNENADGIGYEFRHVLLQRVAHESITQAERRGLHARIVDVLRQGTSDEPVLPELLAHHLTLGGRVEDAIGSWLEGGRRATERSAHVEAIAHLRRGISLVAGVSDAERRRQFELNLQAALIGPLTATQGSTSSGLAECCRRGLQLCIDGDPTPLVFGFLFGLFTVAMHGGRVEEAVPLAELFLKTADQLRYDFGRVIGHRLLGMAHWQLGRPAAAKEHLETTLRLYTPERDDALTSFFGQNTQIHSSALLSLTNFCLGEVEESFRIGIETVKAAEALRHPHSTALSLGYVGIVFGLAGATEQMMQMGRRLISVAEEHQLLIYRTLGTAAIGWALCQRHDFDQGGATIERAIAEFDAFGYQMTLAMYVTILADVRRQTGRLGEAANLSKRALGLTETGVSRWIRPETLRVQALIAYEMNSKTLNQAVESGFREAIASARAGGFPVHERRCLATLSRILGAAASDPAVDARLEELSHFGDIHLRAERAARHLDSGYVR